MKLTNLEKLASKPVVTENKKSSVLTEAFRHRRQAMVRTLDHFGSRSENPEQYMELQMILKLLDAKIPETVLYAYDADSYSKEFTRIMKAQRVVNYEYPDVQDLKRSGFKKIKFSRGTTYLQKGGLLVAVADPSTGVPPMIYMKDGVDPLAKIEESQQVVKEAFVEKQLKQMLMKMRASLDSVENMVNSRMFKDAVSELGFPESETKGFETALSKLQDEFGELEMSLMIDLD